MSDFTKKEKELRAAGVRYLFGAYVDINGVPKSKTVPLSHFKEMMKGSELYIRDRNSSIFILDV